MSRRRFLDALAAMLAVLAGLAGVAAAPARAEEVRAAVAANFSLPMKQRIIPEFERRTAQRVLATYGPTGGLFAQIVQGAPYDVLLSADAERPAELERSGAAVAGTRFTYAFGKIALWSATPGLVDRAGRVLEQGAFAHLALANPKIAPYGLAARQVLQALHLWDKLQPRLVYGQDLNQTYQLVRSGNAALGFVALAQLKAERPADSYWLPDASLYAPIEQQALLLDAARENAAARAFLAFLGSAEGKAIIASFGYGVTP